MTTANNNVGRVFVVDAQQEYADVGARAVPSCQRRKRMAKIERPRWRRGEAFYVFSHDSQSALARLV